MMPTITESVITVKVGTIHQHERQVQEQAAQVKVVENGANDVYAIWNPYLFCIAAAIVASQLRGDATALFDGSYEVRGRSFVSRCDPCCSQ